MGADGETQPAAAHVGFGGGTHCLAALAFGQDGDGVFYLLDGWSGPEADFTWSVGPRSTLGFALPPEADDDGELFLELRPSPFVVPGRLFGQRLQIFLNDTRIAEDCLREGCTLAFPIPRACLQRRSARRLQRLHLVHPDFGRPVDFGLNDDARELGVALHSLRLLRCPPMPPADITALPPLPLPRLREAIDPLVLAAIGLDTAQLAFRFESLGQSCEFGLVQRHMGAEPLGLFRFAGIAFEDLIAGLRRRFEGLGAALAVVATPGAGGAADYDVQELHYKVGFHTFTSSADSSPEAVREYYTQHLGFLHRRFLKRLATGDGICVVQRPGVISLAQARALLLVLRAFGPNSLLYVDQSQDLPSGAVEQLDHGLFHGKLADFAPAGEAGRSDLAGWVSLCANAYRLWHTQRSREGKALLC